MCPERDAFPLLFLDGLLYLPIAKGNENAETQNEPSQRRHGNNGTREIGSPLLSLSLSSPHARLEIRWRGVGSTACGDGATLSTSSGNLAGRISNVAGLGD